MESRRNLEEMGREGFSKDLKDLHLSSCEVNGQLRLFLRNFFPNDMKARGQST